MISYSPGSQEETKVVIFLSRFDKETKEKAGDLQRRVSCGLRFLVPEKQEGFFGLFNACLANAKITEPYFFCLWDLADVQLGAFSKEIERHLKQAGPVSFLLPCEGKHWAGFLPFMIGGKKESLIQVGGISPWLKHPRNKLLDFADRLQYKNIPRNPFSNLFPRGAIPPLPSMKNEKALLMQDISTFKGMSKTQNHVVLKKPDFILVGAQKAGTTSLITWLAQHPEVHTPKVKGNSNETFELHFFGTEKFERLGPRWYLSLFHHSKKKVSGEKTPEYLSDRKSVERMHGLCPESKILLSLRNPVERLWSALRHMRREGVLFGNKTFKKGSLREAHDRIVQENMTDEIVVRGHYFDQISHLLSLYPREQVLILIHERTLSDPARYRKDLFSFLGLPDIDEVPFPRKNEGSRGEEERSSESIEALYDHYRPFNERLFELLDDRIEEWDPPEV